MSEEKEKETEEDVESKKEAREEEEREFEEREEEKMEDSHSEDSSLPTVTLGLVPAPEAASELSNQLASKLSELLTYYVDDNYNWNVEVVVDPFIGAEEDATRIIEQAEAVSFSYEWDYTISITDLPLFKEGHFLVAEVDETRKIGQISIPSLGAAPLYKRVREAVLQLVSEMHHGSSEDARDREQKRIEKMGKVQGRDYSKVGSRDLVKRGLFKRLSPIYRVVTEEKNKDTAVRYVARPRINGYMRVTTGMVRANDPWKIVSTFKSVVALAFTTGAYALIFPTLWQLADSYEVTRSLVLMFTALISMTSWMIITHGLWEKKSSEVSYRGKHLTRLHNTSTVFTLGIGVMSYYVVLFVCFLIAVFIFIPPDLLESDEGIGREVTPLFYLTLAWTVSSLATVIGALGAGLEDEETVLKGTYGYRQRQRKEQMKEEEEQKEQEKKKREEEERKKNEEQERKKSEEEKKNQEEEKKNEEQEKKNEEESKS